MLSSMLALEYLFLYQLHTARFSGYLQPGMNEYIDGTPTLREIVEHELFAIPRPSTCLLTKTCMMQHGTQI